MLLDIIQRGVHACSVAGIDINYCKEHHRWLARAYVPWWTSCIMPDHAGLACDPNRIELFHNKSSGEVWFWAIKLFSCSYFTLVIPSPSPLWYRIGTLPISAISLSVTLSLHALLNSWVYCSYHSIPWKVLFPSRVWYCDQHCLQHTGWIVMSR